MSTTRPFAYNPSPNALIAGTEQVGDLAIGTTVNGNTIFSSRVQALTVKETI